MKVLEGERRKKRQRRQMQLKRLRHSLEHSRGVEGSRNQWKDSLSPLSHSHHLEKVRNKGIRNEESTNSRQRDNQDRQRDNQRDNKRDNQRDSQKDNQKDSKRDSQRDNQRDSQNQNPTRFQKSHNHSLEEVKNMGNLKEERIHNRQKDNHQNQNPTRVRKSHSHSQKDPKNNMKDNHKKCSRRANLYRYLLDRFA